MRASQPAGPLLGGFRGSGGGRRRCLSFARLSCPTEDSEHADLDDRCVMSWLGISRLEVPRNFLFNTHVPLSSELGTVQTSQGQNHGDRGWYQSGLSSSEAPTTSSESVPPIRFRQPQAQCSTPPGCVLSWRDPLALLFCCFCEEREFYIDDLLVRVHLTVEIILVDRPCAMEC